MILTYAFLINLLFFGFIFRVTETRTFLVSKITYNIHRLFGKFITVRDDFGYSGRQRTYFDDKILPVVVWARDSKHGFG